VLSYPGATASISGSWASSACRHCVGREAFDAEQEPEDENRHRCVEGSHHDRPDREGLSRAIDLVDDLHVETRLMPPPLRELLKNVQGIRPRNANST
jgi:hypothetical protein